MSIQDDYFDLSESSGIKKQLNSLKGITNDLRRLS